MDSHDRSRSEDLRRRRSGEELDRLALQAIRLALMEGLTAKEVLARMNAQKRVVRDEREVQWLISRARQRSLADIRVESRGSQPASALLDYELSSRLARASGIRDILVVKTTLASDEGFLLDTAAPQRQTAFEQSDQLHRLLGQAAARYFWDRLRNGDKIALGGGRAIGFMVDALEQIAEAEPKSFSNITVESLVGSMIIWPWAEKQANLDSDAVAVRLAGVLGIPQNNVRLVHLPIALEAGRQEVLKAVAPHISDDPYEIAPDIALLGIGVLNSGHNLLQDTGPQSHAIRAEIEELRTQVLPKAPTVIAEICNRYFWIGQKDLSADIREAVERILHGLNSKTIAIPLEKLNKAKEKVLVAGGAQKHAGLLKVVQDSRQLGLQLTALITDEVSAAYLVQQLPAKQHVP
ncbi:MAG: hypothetical protein HY681_11165 [Chloroflexi bacterium]|nr:hypothetical protein [Chloroflexota bacterium]